MTWVKNQLWVFGGQTVSGATSDIYVFDINGYHWKRLEIEGYIPMPRAGHQAVRHNDIIIVTGGCDSRWNICYDETLYFDTNTLEWTLIESDNHYFYPRSKHAINVEG